MPSVMTMSKAAGFMLGKGNKTFVNKMKTWKPEHLLKNVHLCGERLVEDKLRTLGVHP